MLVLHDQARRKLLVWLWVPQPCPNACLLVVCTVFKKYYYHGRAEGSYMEKAQADAIPGLGINTTFLMNSSVSRSMALENHTGMHDVHYGRETAVLSLMLMLGTLWLGHTLYQFKKRWVAGAQAADCSVTWGSCSWFRSWFCNPVKSGGTLLLLLVEAKARDEFGCAPGKC